MRSLVSMPIPAISDEADKAQVTLGGLVGAVVFVNALRSGFQLLPRGTDVSAFFAVFCRFGDVSEIVEQVAGRDVAEESCEDGVSVSAQRVLFDQIFTVPINCR